MRKEAKLIGANAIIQTKEAREKLQQGIFYNPWLGGYQIINTGSYAFKSPDTQPLTCLKSLKE